MNVSAYEKKLVINTDKNISGIADIYIDYKVDKSTDTRLLFQYFLKVMNTGELSASDAGFESNFLRDTSKEYIPMPIVNGHGELTLTSVPQKDTELELYEVNCSRILTVTNIFNE